MERDVVDLMIAENRPIDALKQMIRQGPPPDPRHAEFITAQIDACRHLLQSDDWPRAAGLSAVLAALLPRDQSVIGMALTSHRILEDFPRSRLYAETMLALQPDHSEALFVLADDARRRRNAAAEIDYRFKITADERIDIVLRAVNLYDLINLMLCQPVIAPLLDRLRIAQSRLAGLDADRAPDRAATAWITFYQTMMAAADVALLQQGPSQIARPLPDFFSGTGTPLRFDEIRSRAAQQGAEALFLVAADEVYVGRYARLYVGSLLANADIGCLVIVHIIGAGARTAKIAAEIGITDQRVIYSTDAFDATKVTSVVCDAPTQPLISKPIAHYQSARFQQAGLLLYGLGLPLFISDIDCLLEQGVRDLIDEHRGADLVLNENIVVQQFAARFTANLLLLYPTRPAQHFIQRLAGLLDAALTRQVIPKWIDQIALGMARHAMKLAEPGIKIANFDVERDINNCMFTEYRPHHFRFLSLYQNFDLDSLPHQT